MVNWSISYASAKKVQFRKMLFVTLTFELMTLKCHKCHVDQVMSNCYKFH